MAVSKSINEQVSKPSLVIDEPIVKPPIKIDPKSAEVYKAEGLGLIAMNLIELNFFHVISVIYFSFHYG